MEHMNFPVKLFAGIAIATTTLVIGCKSQEEKSTDTYTSTDTSKMMSVDTSAMNNNMQSDTGMMNMRNDSATMPPAKSPTDTAAIKNNKMMKGNAKPNAAKKGMKGKTSITLPTKMTGAMTPDAAGVYSNVDYIPSFPGGNKGLQKFFDDNLQYPQSASDDGVEGTVRVAFTIDENGRLMNPAIDGSNEGYGLDEEALRVINKMPSWNPGKIKGKPVKTRFTLPVRFQLN
jgi:periplasmic protein TonB